MFDITLYGHLVNDHIFDDEHETMALGGIANCWRALNDIDSKSQIGLVPLALGEANIYINRQFSMRNSMANLNIERFDSQIKESKISHIMYINELYDVDFISKLDGIISADTCKGAMIMNPNLLDYIDFLFVADEDGQDIDFLRKHIKGHIIFHSKNFSRVIRKTTDEKYVVDKNLIVENANVLGAGDMFAASFLYAIHKRWSVSGAVEYAHIKTAELIRKYNEEI